MIKFYPSIIFSLAGLKHFTKLVPKLQTQLNKNQEKSSKVCKEKQVKRIKYLIAYHDLSQFVERSNFLAAEHFSNLKMKKILSWFYGGGEMKNYLKLYSSLSLSKLDYFLNKFINKLHRFKVSLNQKKVLQLGPKKSQCEDKKCNLKFLFCLTRKKKQKTRQKMFFAI